LQYPSSAVAIFDQERAELKLPGNQPADHCTSAALQILRENNNYTYFVSAANCIDHYSLKTLITHKDINFVKKWKI